MPLDPQPRKKQLKKQQQQQPIKPAFGEIAEPDDYRRAVSNRIPGWIDVLAPNDEVLQGQGGLQNFAIYRELLRDDQVLSTFQQRRLRTISTETFIDPGAEDPLSVAAADALRENIEELPWDDIFDKQLYAIFYGFGVAEQMYRIQDNLIWIDKIKVRKRERFRFGGDGGLYLLRNTDFRPELMPERKFWTLCTGADNHDEPYGIGLARALYWPVFFKRNGIKFWLYYLEKYGQPTALAKVSQATIDDETARGKILEALEAISSDAAVIVPTDAEIEFIEATRSSAGDYDKMKDSMNAAISKIVLSQTMTTDDGSSRSQSETHENVADVVIKSDADLICESFMRGPAKWFTDWNFPGAATPRVWRNTEPAEDLSERAERDKKISELGYEPTNEYIKETYGEGFVKKAEPKLPTVLPGGQPAQLRRAANGEQFTEEDVAALAALRDATRGDQDSLFDAAQHFAEQYETIAGRRVGQLVSAAQDSQDFATFRERLTEIMEELPPEETVKKLERGTLFSRLMGAMRGQR